MPDMNGTCLCGDVRYSATNAQQTRFDKDFHIDQIALLSGGSCFWASASLLRFRPGGWRQILAVEHTKDAVLITIDRPVDWLTTEAPADQQTTASNGLGVQAGPRRHR